MDLLTGKTLDRFQLGELLQAGKSWDTYKARDPKFDRDVAVRILKLSLGENLAAQDYILRVSRSAIRLRHPSIIRYLDLGQVGSQFYVVTEYIPGDTLGNLIQVLVQQGEKVGLSEAALIVDQIAQAVDYARQRGFKVPTLTTQDILLKHLEPQATIRESSLLPYQPILADLGLAEFTTEEDGRVIPISPANELSGIVSLLFELITGKTPAQARGEPNLLLPGSIKQLMRRVFTSDQTQRIHSAGELSNELSRMLPELVELDSKPISAGEDTPLWKLQKSIIESSRRPFPQPSPEPLPVSRSQDKVGGVARLRILDEDHSVRFFPLKPTGIKIGRSSENDIAIDQSEISRYHTQISFDGENYRVTDLGSANGTYIGETRLMPNVPQIWNADQLLRIGNTIFQLEIGDQAGTAGNEDAFTRVVSSQSEFPHLFQQGNISLRLSTLSFGVTPGQTAALKIQISNTGILEDTFNISIQGLPLSWLSKPSESIKLSPGSTETILFEVTPPKEPTSKAGRRIADLRVLSQLNPQNVLQTRLTLSVSVFSEFQSKCHLQKNGSGQKITVQVANLGNASQTFQIQCSDPGQKLAYNPPVAKINISPGQSGFTAIQVQPRARQWFGKDQRYSATASVLGPDRQVQTHNIEIGAPVLIPNWALFSLLGMSFIGILILMVLLGGYVFNNLRSAQEVSVQQTALANLVNATNQAQQSTAAFLVGANQETLSAITATAIWLDGDDDRDGLSNRNELERGTLPQERDTDQDGVSDGEEIQRGLNPLQPDSDGDSLRDGDEISRGLDPLSRDTDKDGVFDNLDPDPGKLPTSTITPTLIPSATPLPFTATSSPQAPQTATATITLTPVQQLNPVPLISGLVPNTLPVGSPAQNITVNGSNFVNGAQVLWNGSAKTTNFLNSTTLIVSIPVLDFSIAGTFPVVVVNPTPGGGQSDPQNFLVTNPKPIITNLEPSEKNVGDSDFVLTVNGANFVSGSKIFWDSTEKATSFLSANKLQAFIQQSDLGTGKTVIVSVVSPGPGGGSDARNLNVNNPLPVLSAVSPITTTVSNTDGITLTLTGSGFVTGSTAIWIEPPTDTPLDTLLITANTLQAVIPVSLLATPKNVQIKVVNPGPGGGSSNLQDFQILPAVPPVGYLDWDRRKQPPMIPF